MFELCVCGSPWVSGVAGAVVSGGGLVHFAGVSGVAGVTDIGIVLKFYILN